ncbi:MAG: helix-turn-helix transcriptional regulator [Desulfovibrio sp.]|nr:helix-turn-helix transcriptional regulator [Desulfovibrio sp.]
MEKRGASQFEVVRSTGICQSAISLFLSGKRGLSATAALKLIRFLNVSPPPPATPGGPSDES